MANIIVYACSSVAIIKTNKLIKKLEEQNHQVKVLVSQNVNKNVVELENYFNITYLNEKISLNKENKDFPSDHIKLAKETDLVIVAPATTNFLAKYNSGICDEINLAFLYAYDGPILFAPAMNDVMWKSLNARNIVENLKNMSNHFFIGPNFGMLYEGYEGIGRMSEVDEIFEIANNLLNIKKDKRIVISYGASKIWLDQIRYITSGATGIFAKAINKELSKQGYQSDLINVSLMTNEMLSEKISKYDIYIASGAIANFNAVQHDGKYSDSKEWELHLFKNIDVIDQATKLNQKLKVFAFKYDNDINKAYIKLQHNEQIKAILYNEIGAMGFNKITGALINKAGKKEVINKSKSEVAELIVEEVLSW
ncbi:flavoprotein [[Mycoplasma] testudinis]|uniref:flavoprotein n=1 Tax=[Mycoplasma] testudinis TaxID=33924 RepID=UPI00048587F2|nr:flavoprotein [[Mycoplasma] testudinis]